MIVSIKARNSILSVGLTNSFLDLKGSPVQHREVQGFESSRFLSYFPRCIILRGGVSTGFHHVSAPPPLNVKRLYRISATQGTFSTEKSTLVVREVRPEAASLVEGDVFVLDKGVDVWQLNTKASVGKEKFKAAEFVQSVISDREGQCRVVVYGKLRYWRRNIDSENIIIR